MIQTWWEVLDLHQRTREGTDLQSAAFDYFANFPL